MKNAPLRILLLLTGGTICSFGNGNGKQVADAKKAQTLIVEKFRGGGSPYRSESATQFENRIPPELDILSENMTPLHWDALVRELKSCGLSQYDGVILLHGTDTLAYTAAMLSVLLDGTPVPVFLVSSQLPLYEPRTNGNDNFRAAVELIAGGIAPDVYAVYRNTEPADGGAEDRMYLHRGAHLRQCANHSENFYSAGMTEIGFGAACPVVPDCLRGEKPSRTEPMPLVRCGRLFPCVLRIEPYTGIDYRWFSLDGVKAVVHGTYHSSTMPVYPYGKDRMDSSHSVMSLKKRCDEAGIPLFVEPCDPEAYRYETTGILLGAGAIPLCGMTSEMAYVRVLLGCCMGLEGEALVSFVRSDAGRERLPE